MMVIDRNEVQCREKWCNNLDPFIKSEVFSEEEDTLLASLVERFGEGSWSKIASYIPGRSDGTVRRRWKELYPGEGIIIYLIVVSIVIDAICCFIVVSNVVQKKKVLPSKHRR